MTIFSETMTKAINIYRGMLRKYLPQAERVSKLHELNLKNPQLYENEIALYHTGQLIIKDILNNLNKKNKIPYGYYSYSGVASFGEYLKNFLSNYQIDGTAVVHRSQKASRALLQAIQLLALPKNQLTAAVIDRLAEYNKIIVKCGSQELQEFFKNALNEAIRKQERENNTSPYRSVLNNFQQQLQEVNARN